jgi:integrase
VIASGICGLTQGLPISGVVRDREDAVVRKPLSEDEMKACRKHLAKKLSKADQLLFRILATTGMRLSEAFQINGEEPKENGVRFCIVDHKTEQSRRRVPLPKDLLPYLPKLMRGALATRF